MPAVRKKEKSQRFVFPTGKSESKPAAQKEKSKAPKAAAVKVADTATKQPDYKLKHKIHFTGLERIIFRQPKIEKKDVLDYYDKIAAYLLPYLKDRVQYTRRYSGGSQEPIEMSVEALFADDEDHVPNWIRPKLISENKDEKQMLLCNEKEQLLFYVEAGCLEFRPCNSRTKSLRSPDYIVLAIDSPDYESTKAIEAAAEKEILMAEASTLKTMEIRAHVYFIESKKYVKSTGLASYICKTRPRRCLPGGLEGIEEVVRKVSVDFALMTG